jgi:predicted AAA+ superfamily ATPase
MSKSDFPRFLDRKIKAAMGESPVVFLTGPRQAGKSTLAKAWAAAADAKYVTLDDYVALDEATSRPDAFLETLRGPCVIDEIQRAPQLFLGIKRRVDEARASHKGRSRGLYLLTGSSSLVVLPKLADALVGRMQVLTLPPFSAAERLGGKGGFVERIFGERDGILEPIEHPKKWMDAAASATFPEISADPKIDRNRWFNGYLSSLIQREAREISDIEKPAQLGPLLRLIAARSSQILNESSLSSDLGMPLATLRRYRAVLEGLHLTFTLPSWQRNLGKRLIRAPEAFISDCALQWHLLGREPASLAKTDPKQLGMLAETFAVIELRRQLAALDDPRTLHYFRTAGGKEVDIVLEKPDGDIVGVEIKAQTALRSEDFNGLRELQSLSGKPFIRGVILYNGQETKEISKDLFMAPFSLLWA